MPINVIQRNRPRQDEALAQAITQGTQGFIQGRKMRMDREEQTLANAYKQAQIAELEAARDALTADREAFILQLQAVKVLQG